MFDSFYQFFKYALLAIIVIVFVTISVYYWTKAYYFGKYNVEKFRNKISNNKDLDKE